MCFVLLPLAHRPCSVSTITPAIASPCSDRRRLPLHFLRLPRFRHCCHDPAPVRRALLLLARFVPRKLDQVRLELAEGRIELLRGGLGGEAYDLYAMRSD